MKNKFTTDFKVNKLSFIKDYINLERNLLVINKVKTLNQNKKILVNF